MAGGKHGLSLLITGDASGALKALASVGAGSENAGRRSGAAFRAAGSAITSAFGPAFEPVQGILSNVSGQLEMLKGKGKSVGTVMTGMGVAGVGAGAALQMAASGDIEAHQQLQAAVQATGHDFEDYKDRIEGAIKKEEHFGHTADDTQTALRNLTSATNDPAKALKYMGVVTDLAAAKHISLAAASDTVAKIYNGKGGRALSSYGITMAKTGSATDKGKLALAQLSQKLAGQASASANTFHGKLEAVKAKVEDTAASIGQKYGPAITAASAGMSVLGAGISGAAALFSKLNIAETASAVASKAAAAAQWLLNTAMEANPIGLVVVALVALVAGFVLAYKKVGWFRDFVNAAFRLISKVVKTVVDFIGSHWKLLLVMLTGPIGLAVLLITKHWHTISAGFAAVARFIGSMVTAIVGFIMSTPKRAAALVGDLWHLFTDPIGKAYNWITGKIGDLIGFFTKLPGKIGSAVAGAFDGLWNAFKSAVNLIIRGWNSLKFTMPSINTHIPGVGKVGGFTVGVPQIPTLHTGGIFNAPPGQREGLALLADGERVLTKQQQRGLGGGVTVIVQGDVISEGQLIEKIRNGLIKAQRSTPQPLLPGVRTA